MQNIHHFYSFSIHFLTSLFDHTCLHVLIKYFPHSNRKACWFIYDFWMTWQTTQKLESTTPRQSPALTSNANRTVTSNLKAIHFRRDLENELIWKKRSFLMLYNEIIFFFFFSPFPRRMSLWQRAERARLDMVPRFRSAIRKNVLHQVWMCSSKYSSECRIFLASRECELGANRAQWERRQKNVFCFGGGVSKPRHWSKWR